LQACSVNNCVVSQTPAEMFEAFRNAKNTSSATFHGQKYLFINGLTDERIYGFRLGKQSVAIFEAETCKYWISVPDR